jgi:hypothetical protein
VVMAVFVIAIVVSVLSSRLKNKTSVAIPPPPTQTPSRQDETAITTETIVPGFPDAIRCSENGHIFYFAAAGKYESLLTTNATGEEERNQVTFNTTPTICPKVNSTSDQELLFSAEAPQLVLNYSESIWLNRKR